VLADVRITVYNPKMTAVLALDASADLGGSGVVLQYEDTPTGCGAATLTVGLRNEDIIARGIWATMNIVEISKGEDTLQAPITLGATKAYVTSTDPWDTTKGEDTQQLYFYDGVTLTARVPVTGIGSDGGGKFITFGAPLGGGTVPAYGAGAIVGRRRYVGRIIRRSLQNAKRPQSIVKLVGLGNWLKAVDSFAITNADIGTTAYNALQKNASRWPFLTITAGNFPVVGQNYTGAANRQGVDRFVGDVLSGVSNGDIWALRVGHDRAPRLVKLYTSATNTYTYTMTLPQGVVAFEPLNVTAEDDATNVFNSVEVLGDTDPFTKQPCGAIVQDATSISLYGQIDREPISNTKNKTNAQCQAQATAILNQSAIASQNCGFRVNTRNDSAVTNLPGGMPDGDVVRGVHSVTITRYNATGSVRNMCPDSPIRYGPGSSTSRWGNAPAAGSGLTFSATGGPNGSGAFTIVGTGSAFGTAYQVGDPMDVVPGQTYLLSGYIDGAALSAGTPTWAVYDVNVTAPYASQGRTSGTGRVTALPWKCPNGVTSVRLVCNVNGCTATNGGVLKFAQPMLEPGSIATGYVDNNAAPSTYGLVGSANTSITADGMSWQDVKYAAIEPDWNATMAEIANGRLTAMLANTARNAVIDQYVVSAGAFPPTFSSGSLNVNTPAFMALFAQGTGLVSIAAHTMTTLVPSNTNWLWLDSSANWTVKQDPSKVAGSIPYGYFQTSASGVLGFWPLAPVGVVDQLVVARPISSTAPIVALNGSIAYNDKGTSNYDASIPWIASNLGLAAFQGINQIAFFYRLHGTAGAMIPTGVVSVVGGSGSTANGTVIISNLAMDATATWDLFASYNNTVSGAASATALVGTTSIHSAPAAGGVATMPGGTTATPTIVTDDGALNYFSPGASSYLYQMHFTLPAAQTPPGGAASGTATWAKTVQLLRAAAGDANSGPAAAGPYEVCGTLPCDPSGSYNAYWTVAHGHYWNLAIQLVDPNGAVSAPSSVMKNVTSFRRLSGNNLGFPAGTTFAATGSVTSYSADGSGAPIANLSITATITLPGGTQPAISSLLQEMLVLAKAGVGGDTNGGGDTTFSDYSPVGEVKAATFAAMASGSALTFSTAVSIPAGQIANLALAFIDMNNGAAGTGAYPFATTSARALTPGTLPGPPSTPVVTLTSTSITPGVSGSTTYSVSANFTAAISPDPSKWLDCIDVVYAPVGASPSLKDTFVPVSRFGAAGWPNTSPQTVAAYNCAGLPAGSAWDLRLRLYDHRGVSYDGGLIGTTVAQTTSKAAAPKMPAGATFTVSGVTTSVKDAGATTGLPFPGGPTWHMPIITVTGTLNESVAMGTWAKNFNILVRRFSAGNPTPTDATTYTETPGLQKFTGGNGFTFVVSVNASPNDSYDIAMQILDGQDGICPTATTCVQLASNVNVPAAGSARWGGGIIGPGHFHGLGSQPTNVDVTQDYIKAGSVYQQLPIEAAAGTNVLDNANFNTAAGPLESPGTPFSRWWVIQNDLSLFTFTNGGGSPTNLQINFPASTVIPANTNRGTQIGNGATSAALTFPAASGESYVVSANTGIFVSGGSLPAGIALTAQISISWYNKTPGLITQNGGTFTQVIGTQGPLTPASGLAPGGVAFGQFVIAFIVGNNTGSPITIPAGLSIAAIFQQPYCRKAPNYDTEIQEGSTYARMPQSNIISLADRRIATAGIAPLAVTTGKIAALAVDDTKIATGVAAAKITYTGGASVDSLKPAQAGADVTASNTANDVANVRGNPIATVFTIGGFVIKGMLGTASIGGGVIANDVIHSIRVGGGLQFTSLDTGVVQYTNAPTEYTTNFDSAGALKVGKSSIFNAQASILPIPNNFVLTYSYLASPSTNMTWWVGGGGVSGANVVFYFPDGSAPLSIAPTGLGTSGSPNTASGASAGQNYWALIYYNKTTSSWSVTMQPSAPGLNPFSASTVASAYADGIVALISSYGSSAALSGGTAANAVPGGGSARGGNKYL
jgi:hypothetical protein